MLTIKIYGKTPLHILCELDSISYSLYKNSDSYINLYKKCVILIKNGADVLLKNNFGELPSDVYLKNNTTASKIHKYLRQKEKEREMLAQCFKRAHIENDDSES